MSNFDFRLDGNAPLTRLSYRPFILGHCPRCPGIGHLDVHLRAIAVTVSAIRVRVPCATFREFEHGEERTDRGQARADQADRWLDVCPERGLIDRVYNLSPSANSWQG
jgi:hypothetical protein